MSSQTLWQTLTPEAIAMYLRAHISANVDVFRIEKTETQLQITGEGTNVY